VLVSPITVGCKVQPIQGPKGWCGAQPIQGLGHGRVASYGKSHAMRVAASTCGSETHYLRLVASVCGLLVVVPGVVHTFLGVIGSVHKSMDGSLYPCRISLSLK
jgi:hypothetical protein